MRRTLTCAAACLALMASRADATTIDLTTVGASGSATAALGGEFQAFQVVNQPTGTGVIKPFLRIQANKNEQGYNTDADPAPLDDKAGTWTHALLLSDIPVVDIGGTNYRQFFLDINQDTGGQGTDQLLSLNQIQIFQANSDPAHTSLTDASGTNNAIIGFGAGVTQIFRMNDLAGDNKIQMDYALNSGSGSGDMFLYILDSNFDTNLSNVILFSQFGNPPTTSSPSNDGFEEWSVLKSDGGGGGGGQSAVPEPASLLLLGTGLGVVARRLRRRKKA